MFELANKRTLLLDEIGEMSPQMQAKLLHVLQDGSFCSLGALSSSRVDVRILADTNINMQSKKSAFARIFTTVLIPCLSLCRHSVNAAMRYHLLMGQMFRRGAMELGQPLISSDRIVEAGPGISLTRKPS